MKKERGISVMLICPTAKYTSEVARTQADRKAALGPFILSASQ